jgi:hypothetical protein
MAFRDVNLSFTTVTNGADSPFAPTGAGNNIAPNTIDTAPLTVPSGSGGTSTPGFNAGVNTNAGRDLGVGGEMWVEVVVTTSVAQAANTTIFQLVTDSTATISTVNVLLSSPGFTAAQLAVPGSGNSLTGYWRAQLPIGSYLEWLGFNVDIVTTNWTAGAVIAGLLENIQQSDLYQSGFTVQ